MTCRFSPDAALWETTPVDNLFIFAYMPHADGFAVQVYLYGLMRCRYPDAGEGSIADALGSTEEAVREAFVYWQNVGLVRIANEAPLEVEYLALPRNLNAPALPGRHFELVQQVQSLIAPRQLSAAELSRVFDWVEVFLFDHGAIITLVEYCLRVKGRRASVKYMDSVARAWADAGVHTEEEARQQALIYHELASGAQAILKRWRLSRAATQDELDLYRKWTKDWGFSDGAVLSACSALTKAVNPSFQYLGSVLEGLRAQGALDTLAVETVMEQQDANAVLARQVFTRAGIARAAKLSEREQLRQFVEEWGMPPEVLLYAAELSREAREPYGFLKRIVSDWHEKGVRTIAQAQAVKPAEDTKAAKQNPAAHNYQQRQYTNEELQHIFVNLDDE